MHLGEERERRVILTGVKKSRCNSKACEIPMSAAEEHSKSQTGNGLKYGDNKSFRGNKVLDLLKGATEHFCSLNSVSFKSLRLSFLGVLYAYKEGKISRQNVWLPGLKLFLTKKPTLIWMSRSKKVAPLWNDILGHRQLWRPSISILEEEKNVTEIETQFGTQGGLKFRKEKLFFHKKDGLFVLVRKWVLTWVSSPSVLKMVSFCIKTGKKTRSTLKSSSSSYPIDLERFLQSLIVDPTTDIQCFQETDALR